MSDTAAISTPSQGRGRNDIAIFVVVGIVLVGLLVIFSGSSERALNRSATGFQGLVRWLDQNDIEARTFTGGGRLVQGEVALRILPLHDTDLDEELERPGSREEVIAQTSERDINRWLVRRKAVLLPTLVVLPKWRGGMRKLGVAHKDLLIPNQEINRVAGQVIGADGIRVRRDPGGFITARPNGAEHEIGLLHPQTMRAETCETIIGTKDQTLLAECPTRGMYAKDAKAGSNETEEPTLEEGDQETFFVLSDPDLLSNHGLRWAQNGDVAIEIAKRFDTSKPVLLDLTNAVVTVSEDWEARRYERDWNDFYRMFKWPFTMIWICFFLVGGLILWRAITRYGPLRRVYEDEPQASKSISIQAKARLLRMSNHDAPLLASHIKARLAHLAADLLGPHRPLDRDPLDVLTTLIARRSPELAEELRVSAASPGETILPPAEIIHRLDRFENCYDKVTHEFGRTSDAR